MKITIASNTVPPPYLYSNSSRNVELPEIPNPGEWLVYRTIEGAEITANFILEKIIEGFGKGVMALINLLNSYSTEIITMGIMVCGVGMMLSPMIGSNQSKWFGRTIAVFWLGIVWRILI